MLVTCRTVQKSSSGRVLVPRHTLGRGKHELLHRKSIVVFDRTRTRRIWWRCQPPTLKQVFRDSRACYRASIPRNYGYTRCGTSQKSVLYPGGESLGSHLHRRECEARCHTEAVGRNDDQVFGLRVRVVDVVFMIEEER
jgi:hypothetical protein